ncbi:anti-sigma factor family protein [Pseudomonas sp. NA-150]|uniref:anti-sigma factor family protein n=1 Tax=Pseudomonas sp. NA-150 TaxID=3367525 RepID=UPI0037CB4840
MLTCKQQVAKSSDYLDGHLSFRERLGVRYHLAICPNCRRFMRQMRLAQAALRLMPESPPADLETIVDGLVREHAAQRSE